jgi:hypothetical protein
MSTPRVLGANSTGVTLLHIRIIRTNNNNSTTPLTYLTAPGCLQTLLTTEVGKKECAAQSHNAVGGIARRAGPDYGAASDV